MRNLFVFSKAAAERVCFLIPTFCRTPEGSTPALANVCVNFLLVEVTDSSSMVVRQDNFEFLFANRRWEMEVEASSMLRIWKDDYFLQRERWRESILFRSMRDLIEVRLACCAVLMMFMVNCNCCHNAQPIRALQIGIGIWWNVMGLDHVPVFPS